MVKRPDLSSVGPSGVAKRARDTARDFKSIMARINRKGWEQLRILSAEKDMPLEEMIIEALNSFLAQNGKPAIIEKRKRPED